MAYKVTFTPDAADFIKGLGKKKQEGLLNKLDTVKLFASLDNVEKHGPEQLIGKTDEAEVYLLRSGRFGIVIVKLDDIPNTLTVVSVFDGRQLHEEEAKKMATAFLGSPVGSENANSR